MTTTIPDTIEALEWAIDQTERQVTVIPDAFGPIQSSMMQFRYIAAAYLEAGLTSASLQVLASHEDLSEMLLELHKHRAHLQATLEDLQSRLDALTTPEPGEH